MGIIEKTKMGRILIDCIYEKYTTGAPINNLMHDLTRYLEDYRRYVSAQDWELFIEENCRKHPLLPVLMQDPFTRRAYEKPRGYAGDPLILEYIYCRNAFGNHLAGTTPTGKDMYMFTSTMDGTDAVFARRKRIAKKMDETAKRVKKPAVLALVPGHLWEAEESVAFQKNAFSRFMCIDYDMENLENVQDRHGKDKVECFHTHFLDIIKQEPGIGKFDLIYTPCLFNYLNTALAARLTSVLFGMLKKDGEFYTENFLPSLRVCGYMEAYMDWWLIYRTLSQIREFAQDIHAKQVRNLSVVPDEYHFVGCLEIVKK